MLAQDPGSHVTQPGRPTGRGVSWLFMAKVPRLQYGVDRIEDGGWVVLEEQAG